MALNKGKAFELKFKADMQKIPGVSIDRIYDQTSGYYGIKNISDFISYRYPIMAYCEVKSVKGNTFPLTNLTQYDALMQKVFIKGVRAGVCIWFYDHQRIIWVPILTFDKIKKDGFKSINIKTIDRNKYYIVDIPSVQKKVYMDSDYSVIFNSMEDNEIKEKYCY